MGDSDSGDSPGDSSSKVSDCHKDTFDDETEDLSNKRLRLLSTIPNAWRIRECRDYEYEHVTCDTWGNRLQARYLGKEPEDCSQWKDNFDDCMLWASNADENAAKRIIEREGVRLAERMKAHYENDVWEKRDSPPKNWSAPLPPHLQEKIDGSYLQLYKQSQADPESRELAATVSARKTGGYLAQAPVCAIL